MSNTVILRYDDILKKITAMNVIFPIPQITAFLEVTERIAQLFETHTGTMPLIYILFFGCL